MMRLVRAELFKLRTTNTWWLFAVATVVSTTVVLVVNCVNAHALLGTLDEYLAAHSHGNAVANIPPEFLARLTAEWTSGHDVVTQAATIFTSGQLIGVLLACLLGIVLITGEYHHQTATTTFVLTPRRTVVVASKLVTAVFVAGLSWLVSTLISVIAGVAFLSSQGYGSQLDHWSVVRAVLLNLAAYGLWAVFGIGLGAVIRSQLAATVTATVLYLAGTAAAASVFELINTYVIKHDWVLTLQVIVPSVASTVMVSPAKTFTQSPSQWVGAAVLIGYGIVAGLIGMSILRRRDVA
jgi:ABC-type transport system involved in multi-copper enzyme maturation permease subunit